jgi:hypothetical protein
MIFIPYIIGKPSDDVLRNGLQDLRKVSSFISDAYRKELRSFHRRAKKNSTT